MTKTPTTPKPQSHPDSNLAIVSMILGVVSLTGPGFLLGIPAIVTSSIALKKDLGGRGLSIAGLVTGIISTIVSLIFLALIIFLFVWGINHPEELDQPSSNPTTNQQTQEPYSSSRT